MKSDNPSPTPLAERVRALARAHRDAMVHVRRHLHAHPELSFEEHETSAYLAQTLTEAGLSVERGFAVTGLRCRLPSPAGEGPGLPTTVLRADIDALPIQEETGLPYRSTRPGVMHACGHDAHSAMVYGAGLILTDLARELGPRDYPGTVTLLFQPAEEKAPGGAQAMIRDGFFQPQAPGSIWGQHINPGLPTGTLGFRPGRMMAAVDDLTITITGTGGHAAAPHLTADPVHAAAHIILALQSLVSRLSNPDTPTVLSFGRMEANGSFNVIPDTVVLSGTFRTVDAAWRTEAMDHIRRIATHQAQVFHCDAQVQVIPGYPPVDNDPQLSDFARACAVDYAGPEAVLDLPLVMWAEDFAYYRSVAPACFYNIGVSPEPREAYNLHNARLTVDEDALSHGAGFMAYLALRDLQRQGASR